MADDFKTLIQENIRLSPEAYAKFIEHIENPREPTEALKKLMREPSRVAKASP
jgi:uncharacterized protein (DUF1778 family)